MENSENVEVNEELQNQSEPNTQLTEEKPGKVEDNVDKKSTKKHIRPEATKKASLMEKMKKDLGELAAYIMQLESGVGNFMKSSDHRFGSLSAAIRILYDEQFKDCPIVKESELNEENFNDYSKIIGYYYMYKDETVIKLQPLEYNWTITDRKPSTELFVYNEKEYPTEDVTFNYSGIALNTEDPVVLTLNCVVGINPFLKLREHLTSLNDKKTDIIM